MLPARLFILVLVIFSDYIGRGFGGSFWWPFFGFFFAPWTTLAYAWAMNSNQGHLADGYLVAVIFAAVLDVSLAARRSWTTYSTASKFGGAMGPFAQAGGWTGGRRGGVGGGDDDLRDNVRVRR
jgi:hypothetical protein